MIGLVLIVVGIVTVRVFCTGVVPSLKALIIIFFGFVWSEPRKTVVQEFATIAFRLITVPRMRPKANTEPIESADAQDMVRN